ncbi:hypothetical protein [Desulfuromonas acetoxidans]|uniref:hypothetical protein n=1 Tax=Desulfuromonas acetoxidans TaxID=891 RepID=UPI00292D1F94|nr:hypothetical protein [Desulfuromonas acetoxidans]
MLGLSKNNTAPYDYYSSGDSSDPVDVDVYLDGSGGTEDTATVAAYLVATDYRYSDIIVQAINESAGLDFKVSLDGSTWSDAVSPADLDALAADQSVAVYIKCVADNDGSVGVGIFSQAKIAIVSVGHPE